MDVNFTPQVFQSHSPSPYNPEFGVGYKNPSQASSSQKPFMIPKESASPVFVKRSNTLSVKSEQSGQLPRQSEGINPWDANLQQGLIPVPNMPVVNSSDQGREKKPF